MSEYNGAVGVKVPKPGDWPGTIEAYRMVKPHIKPQIWNIVSAIGLGIIFILVLEVVFAAIFHQAVSATIANDVAALIVGAFLQATIITMYFTYLSGQQLTLNAALRYGLTRLLRMIGLIIVMDIILLVSLVLLIIPFLFILPRVYLAPYFLIASNLTVSEAFAASWHSAKGNIKKVYGILGLDILIALLFITIIGIPFALYWGSINSASFALLTLYLSQPKDKQANDLALEIATA